MFLSLFFAIMMSCFSPLVAMEVSSLSAENKDLVWNIILIHGLPLFDATMINTLGKVSKKHDLMLRQTAQLRRQYFIEHDKYITKNTIGLEGVVWHKYGAACGKALIGKKFSQLPLTSCDRADFFGLHELIMERRCWGDSLSPCYATWQGNLGDFCALPHEPKAFFDEGGNFCLYAYGTVRSLQGNMHTVIECFLHPNGEMKMWQCLTDIQVKDDNGVTCNVTLDAFLNFPVLLKAFLESSRVDEYRYGINRCCDTRVFSYKGVTLPADYATYQRYSPHKIYFPRCTCVLQTQYSSFDDLPVVVRKKIVNLYKKQQRVRKRKTQMVFSCFGNRKNI